MLTVMRDMATAVASELAHMPGTRLDAEADAAVQNRLIADVLERAVAAGEASLRRGPDLLPVLREAGVVDAGGYGVIVILAGVVAALRGDAAPALDAPRAGPDHATPSTPRRPSASARTSPSPAAASRRRPSSARSRRSATGSSSSATARR